MVASLGRTLSSSLRELMSSLMKTLRRSYRDHLEHLPVPQSEALRTAFGVSPGSVPDRFLVGLAVLGLLSEVAEEQPLICLVDDEQWLDRASAQVLAFVARRLGAESVGLVFAARGMGEELTSLPELVVEGLDEVDHHSGWGVRPAVRAGRGVVRRDERVRRGAGGSAYGGAGRSLGR